MSKYPGYAHFLNVYNSTKKTINYDSNWINTSRYFEKAIDLAIVDVGDIVKCTDTDERRMLLIGTPYGPVIMFEVFTDQETLVCSAPNAILRMYAGTEITTNMSKSETIVRVLLGDANPASYFPNIGKAIQLSAKKLDANQTSLF